MKLMGAKSHYLSIDNKRIHYLTVKGIAPEGTLLLLHGITGNAIDVWGLVPHLKNHFKQIIIMETPGHGKSQTPDQGMEPNAINKLTLKSLNEIITSPAVIFGNSLGGIGAIRFASAFPNKTKHLILSSPGGAMMSPEELDLFLGNFKMDSADKPASIIHKLFAKKPFPHFFFKWFIRQRFEQESIKEFVSRVKVQDLLTKDELQGISVPTSVIWGKQDRLHPQAMLQHFKDTLPKSTRYIEPEELGHIPNTESPKSLAKYILEVLIETR
jgi:pimeloyl-ACP methyl ester carboxylesterase